jgi:hypothetical protein
MMALLIGGCRGRRRPRRELESEDKGSCKESEDAKLLLLDRASHFCGYQEQRKKYDLRLRYTKHRGPILLACNKRVQCTTGLTHMLEGELWRCLGPFTANKIIARPELWGSILLSAEEIRKYLEKRKGFLYAIRGVRKSCSRLAVWKGNCSNASGLVGRVVLRGQQVGKPRWVDR